MKNIKFLVLSFGSILLSSGTMITSISCGENKSKNIIKKEILKAYPSIGNLTIDNFVVKKKGLYDGFDGGYSISFTSDIDVLMTFGKTTVKAGNKMYLLIGTESDTEGLEGEFSISQYDYKNSSDEKNPHIDGIYSDFNKLEAFNKINKILKGKFE